MHWEDYLRRVCMLNQPYLKRRWRIGNNFNSQVDFALFDSLQRHPHILGYTLFQSLQVHSCASQILVSKPVSIVTLNFQILSSPYFLEYEILVPRRVQVLIHSFRLAYKLSVAREHSWAKNKDKKLIDQDPWNDWNVVFTSTFHHITYNVLQLQFSIPHAKNTRMQY